MRLPTAFLLVLLCGPAVAQTPSPTPPAPRVTLDVATSSFQPSPDGILPAKSAHIELLAYTRDGAQKYRAMLPVQAGVGPNGFNAESLGIVAFPSGEAAMFLSSSNTRVALPQDERSVTTLFRV